jgi:6,7-dimethyl-8-ribityllumazine synthase
MANISDSTLIKNTESIHIKNALVILVKTEWNATIVDELENGCIHSLHEHGVKTKTLVVPGAVEIPFAIQHYFNNAKKKAQPDAFIALGCVVKGDTPHFENVCNAVTIGIANLNTTLPVPTIFAVLTVNNEAQAKERIGGMHGHKGEEAALSAIKMILLSRQLKKQ